MIRALAISIICLGSYSLFGQPYIHGGNTRHRFAQMYVGADIRWYPKGQGIIPSATSADAFSASEELRIKIGGIHFWGHADFFIAFNVLSINKSGFATGVETGGIYYPLRLQHKKLRPFVGISFITQYYKAGAAGFLEDIRFPLLAGVGYMHKQHYFTLAASYTYQRNYTYYISTEQASSLKMPGFTVTLGYAFTFETTISAEKNWQNGKTQKATEILGNEGKLNGLTIGIGMSSALMTKESANYDFLNQHKLANPFVEFSLGYYFFKPDLQLNLAFRNINSKQTAFGLEQTARRTVYTFEAYHFLADYHGFAPFLGATLGYEQLTLTDDFGQTQNTYKSAAIKPGLIAGWDIRPNNLQSWYLRTNVRWTPNLSVEGAVGTFNFDQLEINFIELVIFPGRLF
jgi:hypothetical protein